jgi:hypothetical protein
MTGRQAQWILLYSMAFYKTFTRMSEPASGDYYSESLLVAIF